MRFGRTNRADLTPYDRTRRVLNYRLIEAQAELRERAELAIVRQGVIGLYPNGPDKDKAVADFEAAKKSLLCAMGTVDGLRTDLRAFLREHRGAFSDTKMGDYPAESITSHTIVENAYRDFYNKEGDRCERL